MLIIGDKAPLNVFLVDSEGQTTSLKSFLGTTVVIYFYPRDATPGCTVEACSIRDWMGELGKLNVEVIGVSKDSVESHKKFLAKQKLNFHLWSDPEHKLMEAFRVWGERSFMGRTYMGTSRSTFVINPKGLIAHVWEQVTPQDHGEEIYEYVNKSRK